MSSTATAQDFFGQIGAIVVSNYTHQDSSLGQALCHQLGLVFRHAHSHQASEQSTQRPSCSSARQGGNNRSSRNQIKTRNNQDTYCHQGSRDRSKNAARRRAHSGSLRSLAVDFHAKLATLSQVRHQYANVRLPEARSQERVSGIRRSHSIFKHSRYYLTHKNLHRSDIASLHAKGHGSGWVGIKHTVSEYCNTQTPGL